MSNTLSHQPKAKMAFDELLAIIEASEPNTKLPSTSELRRKFGISTETLNLAIRELEHKHHIYSVRGIGLFVAPSRHTILLCDTRVFQEQDGSPYWQILLDTAQAYADAKNEDFKLHFLRPPGYKGDPLPVDVRSLLQTGKISGVLGIGLLQEIVDIINALNVPFVNHAGPGHRNVGFASDDTITLGVPELARRGCRKIAFWLPWRNAFEGSRDFYGGHSKDESFRIALEEAGLGLHPEIIHAHDYFGMFSPDSKALSLQEQGFRLATDVFSMPLEKWPDGILIYNDMMARGVFEVCGRQHIDVGREIFIATASNKHSSVLQQYEEKLICIEYNPTELVEEMFRLLHESMHVQSPAPQSVSVKGHLVAGDKIACSRVNASAPH